MKLYWLPLMTSYPQFISNAAAMNLYNGERGEAGDGEATFVLHGRYYVDYVVRILLAYWPQWLSIKYVFPTFNWSLYWALKYFYSE